jgi:hypothetical protein
MMKAVVVTEEKIISIEMTGDEAAALQAFLGNSVTKMSESDRVASSLFDELDVHTNQGAYDKYSDEFVKASRTK